MPLISPADKTNIAPQCQVKRSGCVILILSMNGGLKLGLAVSCKRHMRKTSKRNARLEEGQSID